MDILEAYKKNPCGTLSIPYWKSRVVRTPADMCIIHDTVFSPALLKDYTDSLYFRLFHDLHPLEDSALADFEIQTAEEQQTDAIVEIINASYEDLKVDRAQVLGYKNTSVYDPQSWIVALEKRTRKIVGCGIADYDREIGELILEWIQVLPEYRGKGVGRAIVKTILNRKRGIAQFATVSGKAGGDSGAEKLYRSCGFVGQDYWHVLRSK